MPPGSESLTAEEVQALDAIATASTRDYRFPSRLEAQFQEYVRLSSRMARISVTVLTLTMFLTAPLWTPLLGFDPEGTVRFMLFVELVLMVPLFAVVTLTLWWRPAGEVTEWLLIMAFIAEVACLEAVRYLSEQHGLFLQPSMSVVVPVAVLTLTRLRVNRCLLFVGAYLGVVLGAQVLTAGDMRARDSMTWLLEGLLLVVVLLSTIWARLSYRRQWAASVLLQLMAYRDSLTGLANRRAFEDHFDLASRSLARGHKRALLFALVDLDQFKKLNDQYGHEYGDGVLAEIALVLAQFARRPMDMAARLGGEEFALLLYDCDPATAPERLAGLVRGFADLGIEHRGNEGGIVTCSVGAVVVPPGSALAEVYRAADALLYDAKRAGRNGYAMRVWDGGAAEPAAASAAPVDPAT